MKAKGVNHIGYSDSAEGTRIFHSENPVTGEELSVDFHEATQQETDRALQLAAEAFPVFQKLPIRERTAFIHAIAEKLEQNSPALIASFCEESGLPEDRAISELKRTCFQLRSYSDSVLTGFSLNAIIDPADTERKPMPKPDLRKVNQGIGPIVVFGASNFPFAYSTAGGDTASALAAGCPVIVKGHPMHPQTSELVASLVAETAKEKQMPEGVFSHLHAKGFEVAKQLVKDPRVKGVGFTGSTTGGMALHKLAGEREDPIPVFAEMGSINPIVVLPSALEEQADIAKTIAASVKLNAGQFCTSPGILLCIQSDKTDVFERQLRDLFAGVPPQVMVSPGMHDHYEKAKNKQLENAETVFNENTDQLNSIQPVLGRVTGKEFIADRSLQDEVFGSFLLLVICKDIQELTEAVSVIRGQLTASLFFESPDQILASALSNLLDKKAGRLIFNGVPTGVEVSPAMQHGGTFPAVTDSRFTSVGTGAVLRWMRPVSYQNCPDALLPEALKKDNPLGILRFINESYTMNDC